MINYWKFKIGGLLLAGVLAVSCSNKEIIMANYQVIPKPLQVSEVTNDMFLLKEGVNIVYPAGNEKMKKNAEFLASYVQKQTGLALNIKEGEPEKGAVCLCLGLENDGWRRANHNYRRIGSRCLLRHPDVTQIIARGTECRSKPSGG